MKKYKIIRQGDVLLIEEPYKNIELPLDNLVITGETGNNHEFKGDFKTDSQYILVEGETVVEHKEHGILKIPTGFYRIERVRDYFRDRAWD